MEISSNNNKSIINYASLGIFFTAVIVIILLRLNTCDNKTKQKLNNSPYTTQEKDFLSNNVYMDNPVNYDYLVNYPNGPWSWGEWSWGKSNEKCKGNSNYSVLYTSTTPHLERGINM